MRIRTTIAFALSAVIASVDWAEGIDLSPFSAILNSDVRTAYISRGRVVENRPVNTILGRAACEIGPLGRLGLWNWDVSSLGGSRQDVHHRAFNEVDIGVFWHYDWKIDEDGEWKLTNDLLKDWITLDGYTREYRARKVDATINEWRFEQALVNPYVTPFYLLRRGIHPNEWFYTRIGARRSFALPYDFSFTPIFYAETGNSYHFERRYGKRVDGGRHYHGGVQALNLLLELSWKASDNVSLFTSVHQFGVVCDDARDAIKAKTTGEARRDLTVFSVGLRARF